MRAQIKLGRMFGVEVGLHYSWFIIAFLITLSLAAHFQQTNPEWDNGVVWVTAIVTGALFFAAIIAHEFSHAAVAKARGLPVRSITLFALGGVAQIEKEAADAKTEFWMGIAGPIASAAIGFVLLGIASALGWVPASTITVPTASTPLLAMLIWLGYMNIVLAVFNMIPGFPLDGGRVLRAIVWWTTGDAARSTRIAARAGQVVAFAFIALGLIQFFGGAGFGGLWMAFIGWFLLDAARASYAHVRLTESLSGVRVKDVMNVDCSVVDGSTTLQTLADEYLLRTGQRCFLVVEDGRVAGLITPREIRQVERVRWPDAPVESVMRRIDTLRTVAPDAPVVEALEVMAREDVNQLPVVSNGRLDGMISRGQVLRLFETRAELNM